jgi:hypothetical protein
VRSDDIYRKYSDELHRRLGYRATWLPSARLEAGMVGVFDGAVFNQQTHLRDLGVEYALGPAGESSAFVYQSEDRVNVELSGSADAATGVEGHAVLAVDFSGRGALLFHALGLSERRISNQASVERQVRELRAEGIWRADWRVITVVVAAESLTAAVSGGTVARLDLSSAGALTPGLNLADTSLGLKAVRQQGLATAIVAAGRLTPLYQAMHLKRRVRSERWQTAVGPSGEEEADDEDDLEFVEFDPLADHR